MISDAQGVLSVGVGNSRRSDHPPLSKPPHGLVDDFQRTLHLSNLFNDLSNVQILVFISNQLKTRHSKYKFYH